MNQASNITNMDSPHLVAVTSSQTWSHQIRNEESLRNHFDCVQTTKQSMNMNKRIQQRIWLEFKLLTNFEPKRYSSCTWERKKEGWKTYLFWRKLQVTPLGSYFLCLLLYEFLGELSFSYFYFWCSIKDVFFFNSLRVAVFFVSFGFCLFSFDLLEIMLWGWGREVEGKWGSFC